MLILLCRFLQVAEVASFLEGMLLFTFLSRFFLKIVMNYERIRALYMSVCCADYVHLHNDSCSKTVSNKTNEVVNSTQTSGGGRVGMVGGFVFTSASAVHVLIGVVSCLFSGSFI